jgi:DNA-binding transcriptional MocR family regulator
MLAALEREMPDGATWTKPKGGFFIWVTLPDGVDAVDLVAMARENLVDYIPGPSFYSDGSGRGSLRLSFSNVSPEQIDTGIGRLAATVKAATPVATVAD